MGWDFFPITFFILDVNDSIFQNNSDNSLIDYTNNVFINTSIWYARLGHIGQDQMMCLAREGLLELLPPIYLPICEHCLASKATRKPFGEATRAELPL